MVPVTGVSVIVFWVRRRLWHLVCIQKFLSPKLVQKRDEARKLISEGIDPCEQKRVKKKLSLIYSSLFEHIARRWHASNKQWAQSHSDKVLKSLETHVFPFIGNRDITTLNNPDLLIPVRAAEAKTNL